MGSGQLYRFPKWKDAAWNSYERQKARYDIIKPYLKKNCVGAELGVYKGGFAEFLLPHCRKLYLVDCWYRAGGFWKTDIEGDSRVSTVIEILNTYRAEIEAGQVEPVIEFSESFLNALPEQHLDFVYLDSGHLYESTLREIELARQKLKPGGFIFGDDYDPDADSNQHGVFRAVNEVLEDSSVKMFLNDSRQWGLLFRE